MAQFTHHEGRHHHWIYVWIPVFGAFIWCATLLAMIITWKAQGEPHYSSQVGNLPYISDIGADILKPLFITGAAITAICFVLSLSVERGLRHSGRLLPNMRRREKVLSGFAILGSVIGGVGLILLSIFDTKRHPNLHHVFLLVFMVGVALSAIFSILEYRWISKDFHSVRHLRFAYIAKGLIASVLILLAIGFGIALFKGSKDNNVRATFVAGILEWIVGFGFTFYLLTFYFDLRMSKGVQKGELSKERLTAGYNGNIGDGPGELSHAHDGGMRQV